MQTTVDSDEALSTTTVFSSPPVIATGSSSCLVCGAGRINTRLNTASGEQKNLRKLLEIYGGLYDVEGGICRACERKLGSLHKAAVKMRAQCQASLRRSNREKLQQGKKPIVPGPSPIAVSLPYPSSDKGPPAAVSLPYPSAGGNLLVMIGSTSALIPIKKPSTTPGATVPVTQAVLPTTPKESCLVLAQQPGALTTNESQLNEAVAKLQQTLQSGPVMPIIKTER